MPDEPDVEPEPPAAEQDEPSSGRQPSKPRLPLMDDEYPMLIDRDEEG
jgi:hypothetical protein